MAAGGGVTLPAGTFSTFRPDHPMARPMTAHTALPDPAMPLDDAEASAAFAAILDGTVSDEAIAAF